MIPEENRKQIGDMISSADSVVGIDAKETHIIIIHKLNELERRMERIEKQLKKQHPE